METRTRALGVAVSMLCFCSASLSVAFFLCVQCSVPYLVSAQGAGQDKLGIYVKSVVKGGAADVVSTTFKDVNLHVSYLTKTIRDTPLVFLVINVKPSIENGPIRSVLTTDFPSSLGLGCPSRHGCLGAHRTGGWPQGTSSSAWTGGVW